nr:uncharacterized protein LOC128698713 [Cherax quadricarinatus]
MILLLLSTFSCLTGLRYAEAFYNWGLIMAPGPEVEDLRLEAPMPGYAVLNVTTTKCIPSDSNKDVHLDIYTCDGSKHIVLRKNICEAGGATFCLPSIIKSSCVRVKAGNVSSGNFTLPPFQPFDHSKDMSILPWDYDQDTNSSIIRVERQHGVYRYLMTLTPENEQVSPAGDVKTSNKEKAECGPPVTLTKVFLLEAVNDTETTFTANWSSLNTSCVYRVEVRPFNACEEPVTLAMEFRERLRYPDISTQTDVAKGGQLSMTVVLVVVVVVCILVAVLSALHLYKTLKLTRRALFSVYQTLKHSEGDQQIRA